MFDNMKRWVFGARLYPPLEVVLKNKCSQITEPQLFYIVCSGYVPFNSGHQSH
jgi:hypothetical protein